MKAPRIRFLIYEHVKTGEAFIIPDPRLRLDQLDSVQQEIYSLLARGEGVVSCQCQLSVLSRISICLDAEASRTDREFTECAQMLAGTDSH